MRLAFGMIGGLGVLGGGGWAALSLMAAAMNDGPTSLPTGELVLGGLVALVGAGMIAGAIHG